MRTTSLIFLLLSWLSPLFAQPGEDPASTYRIPDEYAKIHKEGETYLLQKEYAGAIRAFKKVLKRFPDFPPALRSMGACYELMGDFEKASEYYGEALMASPNFSRAMYFELGHIYYKCGKYRTALSYFQEFDSLRTADSQRFTYNGAAEREVEMQYYQNLPASIRACKAAVDSIQFWNISSVTNLGPNINSGADEYFPFLTNSEDVIFYTSRKNDRSDENLFVSSRPKGEWRIGEPASGFNTDENEGMTSLVRDGRRIYFTACQRPQVLGACDIWQALLDGTTVKDVAPLIGYANSGGWESQASVSCDGSTLFFASNREGGLGGTDLWMSSRMADGRWGEPVNLGPNINTTGDEEAPFISNDNKVLYFSSTGHLGLGEQDLFMSRINEATSEWGFAINLGMPVNTSYRELGVFISADGKTGYFSSDRKGGYGGMDIYHFTVPEPLFSDPVTYVEAYVRDSITHLPIKTTVHIKGRSPVPTDDDGRIFLCVKSLDTLRIEVRADDYHGYKNSFNIPLWDNRHFYSFNLLLDPLFRLPVYSGDLTAKSAPPPSKILTNELKHDILFDFDGAELKDDALQKLKNFLDNAFDGKTVVNVEIIGYADDVGSDSYNLILSEKRAKAVGVYLKEKGIRVDKIYIEGRGEHDGGKPKWANRRVEVVIHLAQ